MDLFKGKNKKVIYESPYSLFRKQNSTLAGFLKKQRYNYIIINNKFNGDKYDADSLLNFVKRGNNCFISSKTFSKEIKEKLKIKTSLKFTNPKIKQTKYTFRFNGKTKKYSYKKIYTNHYFTTVPRDTKKIIFDNNRKPVLIKLTYGRGVFILSTIPQIFTNNAILHSKNETLTYAAISLLPVRDIYLDEYFTAYGKGQSTPLRVILRNTSLRRVYIISMFLLLLFIIVKARRKQRIIPVITPPANESLNFIEMVGKLYFEKGDNKDLAHKKIMYFYEFIRTHFSVSPNKISIEQLAAKTDRDVDDLRKLFDLIKIIEMNNEVTDKDLIQLNDFLFKIISSN